MPVSSMAVRMCRKAKR